MGVSVYKKKDTKFYWMRVEKKPFKVEQSTKLIDKAKAQELADMVYSQLEERWLNMMKGLPDCEDDPNMTISQTLEWVMKKRWAKNKDGSKSARQVKRCITLIGDIPIRGVSASVVEHLREKLEMWPNGVNDDGSIRYLSGATVDRYMRAMCTLMNTLQGRSDVYKDLVVPHFPMENATRERERILFPEEEAALFTIMKQRYPHYHDLYIVLLDTGMRVSEALNMTYQGNLNADCSEVRLKGTQTKNKKPRTLPVTARSQAILQARQKDSPWQPFHADDIPSPTAVSQKFQWYRELMGIDDQDFVPHMLRHTCCTRLLEGGVDFFRVQSWMGHSTAEMTRRYGHLTAHSLEGARDVIDAGNKANAEAHAQAQRNKFAVVNG